MSAKKSAEVVINGKVCVLTWYEEEEYLQKIAAYINNKIAECDEIEEFRRFPTDKKATFVELNIADDYFKAKSLVEKYESDLEEKDKEIYDLKHDLISDQVKIENYEETTRSLENDKKELLAHKAKLEASLEDALLGSVETSN